MPASQPQSDFHDIGDAVRAYIPAPSAALPLQDEDHGDGLDPGKPTGRGGDVVAPVGDGSEVTRGG